MSGQSMIDCRWHAQTNAGGSVEGLCVIYFIQEDNGGAVKIGHAKYSVESRVVGLQVGNPRILNCVGTMEGGFATERALHHQFAHINILGEWFKPLPELMDYIQKNAHPWVPRVVVPVTKSCWGRPVTNRSPIAAKIARQNEQVRVWNWRAAIVRIQRQPCPD
jgi:hypothetical protein